MVLARTHCCTAIFGEREDPWRQESSLFFLYQHSVCDARGQTSLVMAVFIRRGPAAIK